MEQWVTLIWFQLGNSRGIHIELQTGLILTLINFQLRFNPIMSSRAQAWIHIQFDQFSIENQSNNEPESRRVNLNAHTVSNPYVCDGLGDCERATTSQTIVYVTFGRLSTINNETTLLFPLYLWFWGSRKQNTLWFLLHFLFWVLWRGLGA